MRVAVSMFYRNRRMDESSVRSSVISKAHAACGAVYNSSRLIAKHLFGSSPVNFKSGSPLRSPKLPETNALNIVS